MEIEERIKIEMLIEKKRTDRRWDRNRDEYKISWVRNKVGQAFDAL